MVTKSNLTKIKRGLKVDDIGDEEVQNQIKETIACLKNKPLN